MKSRFVIYAIALSLIYVACTSAGRKEEVKNVSDSNNVSTDIIQDAQSLPDTTAVGDTVLNISFANGKEQTIHGRLGLRGPAIHCYFETDKPQSLTATIIPEKPGCNIRISQIVMPGGKSDGPFNREIKYKLSRKGKYQLIIDHNMMAGDPEVCVFQLKASLK